MIRWILMVRKVFAVPTVRKSNKPTLFGILREKLKVWCRVVGEHVPTLFYWPKPRVARPSMKPRLEVLEALILPSVSTPATPDVTGTAAQMVGTVEQEMASLLNEVISVEQALVQVFAQEMSYVEQQVDQLLGITPNAPTPMPAPSVSPTQPSSGWGSGSGVMTTAPTAPNQRPQPVVSKSGSDSGSGATTTGHDSTSGQGIRPMMASGSSGSGGGTMGSGGGTFGSGGGTFGSGGGTYGSGTATISGTVWLDNNDDGLMDNGELGLQGITVDLMEMGQTGPVAQTITDANGNYQLTISVAQGGGVNPGTGYSIQVVIPSSYMVTMENVSGGGINSNIDDNGSSNIYPLQPGDSVQVNAGLIPPPNSATVSGQVWLDNNGDGSLDNGEMGFSGIIVQLYTSTGEYLTQTTTDGNGNFQFVVLPMPGTQYRIGVVLPNLDEATIQGPDSCIDGDGLSPVFALAAGGVENIKAGIRSMNVTTTEDDASGPIQNQITLRDSIETGNNGPPARAVTFQVGLSGTISLQAALDPIQQSYDIDGPGSSTIFVQGNGNAGNPYRIFFIDAGVTSTISGLTIQSGYVPNFGGGLYNGGNLTLTNDIFCCNQAITEGAGGGGGAIANDDGATLTMNGVTIDGNFTDGLGGGILNYGELDCSGCLIMDNTGDGPSSFGGGLANLGGFANLRNNTEVSDNTVTTSGGGIYENGGTVRASTTNLSRGVTITNNSAPFGGGIFLYTGKLILDAATTVSYNKATGAGGGGINDGRNCHHEIWNAIRQFRSEW